MLFLLLLPGVREEQGRKREHCRERSQENLTWVELRGAQRAVVAELVGEDQGCSVGTEPTDASGHGQRREQTPLRPGKEASPLTLTLYRIPV